MQGHIHIITPQGEVLIERAFYSRMHYMSALAEMLETFGQHRIEITFFSVC